MEIYVLLDCDGEPIVSYTDQDEAIEEAEINGCTWIALELYGELPQ